jgi:Ca-activated chloride channel family protein
MLKHHENGRINAIIVLSDGSDTDSVKSLDSLLVKVGTTAKEGAGKAPVRIFTIAYGEEGDKDALQRISKASGGQMFDASDPDQDRPGVRVGHQQLLRRMSGLHR